MLKTSSYILFFSFIDVGPVLEGLVENKTFQLQDIAPREGLLFMKLAMLLDFIMNKHVEIETNTLKSSRKTLKEETLNSSVSIVVSYFETDQPSYGLNDCQAH